MTEETIDENAENSDTVDENSSKRERKVKKRITGTTLDIHSHEEIDGVNYNFDLTFDTTQYPANVQALLMASGAGHKIGDAGAGLSGQEKVDAMNSVHEQLMRGEFNLRKASKPKLTVDDITSKLAGSALSEAEKAAVFAALGIKM